ncbi:hypothetical protein ACWD3J_06320 [Streptomyces sp. NPDC002755]|uniref:hypothetical protein n=1 Tax=Streptomyces sp. NPDC002884 TaxID=3154544 RepID=UPI00331A7777
MLTRSVTGTIDRPFLPGDEFTEFTRTADGTVELAWGVAEYERGKRVTIELVDLPGSISYTFKDVPENTLFPRVVNNTDEAPSGVVTAGPETAPVANLKASWRASLLRRRRALTSRKAVRGSNPASTGTTEVVRSLAVEY